MKENWWINFKKEQKSVFDQESDLGSYLGLVPTVLVSLVCHNKMPQTRWLIYSRILFSTVLEAGGLR